MNNEEQSPALRQAVENMATMREAYDNLSQAAEAYNTGKVQLAQNITAKGVTASASETLPELAEKVNAISQETYEIQGGEMYAKQLFGVANNNIVPGYWNLYDVLAQLLSDGRLVNYGGILLAEYYKGYDSLALSGAGAGGAYVVSDKDSDGNFIMYTEDTTHVWATEFDGKGNRWVAYCFADEYHDFQITDTNTSPRSIFIGRKVGTITSLVNGRVSQIVVPDGNELMNFYGNYTQNWDKRVVIRNIKNLSTGNLLYNPSCESVYIKADNISGGAILYSTTSLSVSSIEIESNNISNVDILTALGAATTGIKYLSIKSPICNCKIDKPDRGAYDAKNIKEIYLFVERASIIFGGENPGSSYNGKALMRIDYIENNKGDSVNLTKVYDNYNEWRIIGDLRLKNGWCKPLDCSTCIYLVEDGITNNITEHILKRLKQDEPDCGDGVTITLGSTNLAKLTSQESVDLLDDLTNIYGYTFA